MLNQKKRIGQPFDLISDKSVKMYPHFDSSIMVRSIENEITEPLCGEVQGSIPKWLNGCLLRNGPGKLNFGDVKVDHLFDSPALLHK